MNRVNKFFHLSSVEQYLLVKAGLLVGVIRLGLGLLPFSTFRRLLVRMIVIRTELNKPNRFSADQLIWAVTVVSRYVPRATCLTQALALQVLLQQERYEAVLRIGVTKNEEGRFHAHAWVESQGKVLIGGSELGSFTTLLSLKEEG